MSACSTFTYYLLLCMLLFCQIWRKITILFQERKHCDSIPISSVGFNYNLCIAALFFFNPIYHYCILVICYSVPFQLFSHVWRYTCGRDILSKKWIFRLLSEKTGAPRGYIVFIVCLCTFKNCPTYKHLLSSCLLHCTLHSLWMCPYLSFFVLHDGASGYCQVARAVYCFPSAAACCAIEDGNSVKDQKTKQQPLFILLFI